MCPIFTFTWCLAGERTGLRGFFWPRQKYEGEAHVVKVQDAIRGAAAELSAESGSDVTPERS